LVSIGNIVSRSCVASPGARLVVALGLGKHTRELRN
jgi:hypothetical protein